MGAMSFPFEGSFGYPNSLVDYPLPLITAASDVVTATNPAFTSENFLEFYPTFANKVPIAVIDAYLAIANATVLQARWHEAWSVGMCNFVAHFLTLYLQSQGGDATNSVNQLLGAGVAEGLLTSKAVGDVSASYDFSGIDFPGWPGWKTTIYGRQFATMARLMAKAPTYIY